MKTVLIVEDEKLIRQGIKTMVQRSGVPVEVIMECNNGQMALEILKSQEIDVMFTDIRMPKMSGIELMNEVNRLPEKPLTVVVSGYDDFSYAVEMLRLGVKEYILKPVDREKVKEILERLDQEISAARMNDRESRSIGHQQLKYLVLNENITQAETEVLINQYEAGFFPEYVVICLNNTNKEGNQDPSFIYLNNIEDNELYITGRSEAAMLLRTEARGRLAGISSVHSGLRELKEAYREAYTARKTAFWTGEMVWDSEEESGQESRQEEFKRNKLLKTTEPEPSQNSMVQLAQMLGTERSGEAIASLMRCFEGAGSGLYDLERFEANLSVFFRQLQDTYKNVLQTEELELQMFWHPYCYPSAQEYAAGVEAFLNTFAATIQNQFDDYKNKQKIQMAIQYIQENYDKDLNMAVVSNHISMNYSLFSFVFKQYTGSNFVNYLKELRMKEGKRLLEETDLRVNEISQRIGYENEKHFMKTFKSVCGVSPTEYRKNMQYKQ